MAVGKGPRAWLDSEVEGDRKGRDRILTHAELDIFSRKASPSRNRSIR
jgi:hypothetical protein